MGEDLKKAAALKSVPTSALSRLPLALSLANPRLDDVPIVYVNVAFEQLTGYPPQDVVGRNCRFLQGDNTEDEARAKLRRAIERGEDAEVEITNYRKDGSAFRNALSISPIRDDDDEVVLFLGTQRDADADEGGGQGLITELAELQHRVKNHLSMIVGLIRLQAKGDKAADDYQMLARRVEALQILYQELNEAGSDGSNEIPLGAYVSRIAAAISHLDGRPGIRSNVQTDEVTVDVSIATRIGLLLSEVLTNAFQHAFQGRDSGVVETRLMNISSGRVRIEVMDDGVGFPEGTTWPEGGDVGSNIVRSLLRGLRAEHRISSGGAGTTITIDIPPAEDAG
ncbi:MAG: PAS domain-containing protein [Pseudomonadota bacterium]